LGESTPNEIARATRTIVAEIVATAGFEPPPRFLGRIETFTAALALWGAKLNLTAAPDDPAELAFHIIDSLAPLIPTNGGIGPILAGSRATLAHEITDAQLPDAPRKTLEDTGLTSPPTLTSDSNVPATRYPDRPNLTTLPPIAMTSVGLGESTGTQPAGTEFADAFVTESTPMLAARAALADAFVAGSRVLDLGSGAGFPALILAAACDADFLLMEARRKRASFLRVTAAEMGLSNVQVDSARAEPAALRSAHHESSCVGGKTSREVRGESSRTDTVALPKIQDPSHGENVTSRREGAEFSGADAEASQVDHIESSRTDAVASPRILTDSSRGETEASRRGFDVVTARAFAEPAIVFETAAAVLREGGRVILYASAAQREEIERASAAMFDPPVFLPYELKHASTVTVASGAPRIDATGNAGGRTVNITRAATRTVARSSGDTHAATGTVAGGSGGISDGSTGGNARVSTGSVPNVTIGGVARGSTGSVGSSLTDEVVRSTTSVVHMLAICRRR
jgi:16S rRNA G527 N7-methylase RsmG